MSICNRPHVYYKQVDTYNHWVQTYDVPTITLIDLLPRR